ncbi:MAG: hypothetical protein FJY37_05210 [Betaproteobacteria bacterium]|nr:hypothetical protein [Betaproteobacteria bacterium]
MRINGFVRTTEDIDVLFRATRDNGERVKRARSFLDAASELDPTWFEAQGDSPETIRVADEIIVELFFAANGETYESLQPYIRAENIDGVTVRVLNTDELLRKNELSRKGWRGPQHAPEAQETTANALNCLCQRQETGIAPAVAPHVACTLGAACLEMLESCAGLPRRATGIDARCARLANP